MMLSSFAFVALISVSALDQPQGSASTATLLQQSESMGPVDGIISPLSGVDASIENASSAKTNTDSIGPQHKAQHKAKINQSPPTAGAPGHSAESLLNPPRNKEMVKSSMIASGMVEAFMHKQHLLPGEKSCLEDSVSQLTGDLVGTGQDVIDAIRALTNGAAGKPGAASKNNVAGVDAALKLTYLVSSVATLWKNCVQDDALRKLNETAHHLFDMKYLGHRLLVSGVDIADSLVDSILSFEGHDYYRFGDDIGTILRKVLLSNSTHGAQLPEGVPENEVIQQTSEGLIDGFFAGGSSMEITDSAHPDVDIRLDLHRCIGGNEPFFKQVFLSIWNAFAMFSANGEQHGLQDTSKAGSPQWTNELMLALMQLPSALERCDIDIETQGMLMESIQTLGQVHAHIDFPKGKASMDEVSKRIVKAVNYWERWDFKKFGDELGVMLREFVLMVYPMKYSVDRSGSLRRQRSWTHFFIRCAPGITPGFLILSLLGASLTVCIGLVVVRRMRSTPHAPSMREVDAELACDNLIDEVLE